RAQPGPLHRKVARQAARLSLLDTSSARERPTLPARREAARLPRPPKEGGEMKLSNYSLNYSDALRAKRMEIFAFLVLCGSLERGGASLHVADLASTERDYLKRIRRAYLDSGLSISMLTVSTDFGQSEEREVSELARACDAVRVAELLGAPL